MKYSFVRWTVIQMESDMDVLVTLMDTSVVLANEPPMTKSDTWRER